MRNSQSRSTKPIGILHDITCDLLKKTACERKFSFKMYNTIDRNTVPLYHFSVSHSAQQNIVIIT